MTPAALVVAALASAVAPAEAIDSCQTDLDCSLNGACAGVLGSRSCLCSPPWSGFRCGIIVPGLAKPGGAYGFSPNISSWGGNPVLGEDGLHHMFVAEIPGGLRNWGHASQCVHATADSIEGPYNRSSTVLGAECHNPSTLRHPKTGTLLMFHIGEGPSTSISDAVVPAGAGNASTTAASGFLHTAASPDGPWTAAKTAPKSCNNPAPAYHPNGTLFVVCNHLDITVATDDWEGGWSPLRSIGHPGPYSRPGNYEDPYLWFDIHGNFHIMYHVYCLDPYQAHNECNAGHAFSTDGFNWVFGADEPYSGLVNFTDGTSTVFSTRERPHLVFADKARHIPMGVFTAVSSQPVSPACSGCNSHACSQCKVMASCCPADL